MGKTTLYNLLVEMLTHAATIKVGVCTGFSKTKSRIAQLFHSWVYTQRSLIQYNMKILTFLFISALFTINGASLLAY